MGSWSDPENKTHVDNNIYEQVVKAIAKDGRGDHVLLDFIKEIEGRKLTDKEIANLYYDGRL